MLVLVEPHRLLLVIICKHLLVHCDYYTGLVNGGRAHLLPTARG